MIEAEPQLPTIRGDRIQLQQVLVNLMVNAAKAMSGQAGPRNLTVRSSLAEPGNIVLSIQDTGPGVDPADISRLFQPFFTTKQDGMGMGLAICRSTVEAHGGQLSVQSTLGSGAEFCLTLPAIHEQAHP